MVIVEGINNVGWSFIQNFIRLPDSHGVVKIFIHGIAKSLKSVVFCVRLQKSLSQMLMFVLDL